MDVLAKIACCSLGVCVCFANCIISEMLKINRLQKDQLINYELQLVGSVGNATETSFNKNWQPMDCRGVRLHLSESPLIRSHFF